MNSDSPLLPRDLRLELLRQDRGGDGTSQLRRDLHVYLDQIADAVRLIPVAPLHDMVSLLEDARWNRRLVFTCGNGGSAATAMHFASDLSKGACAPGKPDFRVICLADNLSTLTALANDISFEEVFARRLSQWVGAGDVLIAISGSGNSPNVLNAVRVASVSGATTIGLTGCHGGELASMVDLCVQVPCDFMEQVEDVHLLICHAVTTCLRSLQAPGRPSESGSILAVPIVPEEAHITYSGVNGHIGADGEITAGDDMQLGKVR